MRRRDFLAGSAAGLAAARLSRFGWAADVPPDIRITRVVCFELELKRPKHIGKNSYRHDHGRQAFDRIARVYTNAGVDGFGPCSVGANECATLLGRSPLEFFNRDARKVACPLGRFTSPIWDLVGKILRRPVHALLAEPGSKPAGGTTGRTVPVYDGSIYFTDLRPQHLEDWRDEFKRELDASMAQGHRAFKIKIGRGKLWMRMAEGDQRDIEVVRLIRRYVGPDVLLGVDANDGYDLERTKRLLQATADCKLAFIEEMFPDDVPKYLELKAFMRENKLGALIADGENKRRPQDMQAWVQAKAVDILQGDMNQFGVEDVQAEAIMGRPFGATVAPHNWGSLFGFYLQVQAGGAIPNFYRAEEDPLTCKAVGTDEYRIRDGRCTLPEGPGLGLTMLDRALPDVMCVHFDLKA
jgi:L-alanine-DL-glutamate epimerase-like enolase superfamily enzyme